MNIADLFLMFFSVAGLVFLTKYAEILDILKIRQFWEKSAFFSKLFGCAYCSGFYFSIMVGILFGLSLNLLILFSFAGAAFALLWERTFILIDDCISKINK